MAFTFSEENLKRVDAERAKYPTSAAAVMHVLWIAQEQNGNFLTEDAIKATADVLEISPAHVFGVVSFYTMYNTEKIGKYHLQVCRNLSCSLLGAKEILQQIKSELNLQPGETTPDFQFTLTEVECLGSCGTAPAMQVNDDYIENLTPESVKKMILELKAK